MNALQLIDPEVRVFNLHDSKEEIINTMDAGSMSFASIVNDLEWIGYVSLEALKLSKEGNLEFLIEEALSNTHLFSNQHLYEIYPIFQQSPLSNIAVLDEDRRYLGSISKSIIGEKLLNTLTYKGIGSIIVLNVFHTDFVLSRISNIIEENNAKIVGLMIEEVGQNYRVNLKLNTMEISPILASFQRFSIEVDSYHSISDHEWQNKKAFEIAFKHFDL